jgi:GNAT superfamily N-acetyltransferase
MIDIAPLRAADRAEWEALARGYKAFYRDEVPDEDYARVWALLMAGEKVHGLAARIAGRMVGLAHYLFHPQAWLGEVCYLQDLFTVDAARGQGVGTALIGRVAEEARARGAARYYWLTKEDNRAARSLYDKVARFKGFVRYDHKL